MPAAAENLPGNRTVLQEEQQRLESRAGAGLRARSLLGNALAFAASATLLVVGVMFSVLILTIAAIAAMGILGYLWWKTRDLRRRMQERPPGGRVIEGEAIRDDLQ
jgi:Flp pilus assembly protein TadB